MTTETANLLPPGCKRRCPACAHRTLAADESEKQKQHWLHNKLADWSNRIQPMNSVRGEARWAYREKVCLTCAWHDAGWQIGMNLGDEVLGIPDCPVHSARVRLTLHTLLEHLPGAKTFQLAYFVQSGAQVTLVLKTRALPDTAWLSESCKDRLTEAGAEGLWLHLHPAAGKKIFNKPGWHLIWGQPRSVDSAGFEYGPVGFQQLIPKLYRAALLKAQVHLQPSAHSVLIDLYCGSGATLKRWTDTGASAIGVELGGQACKCAARNAPEAEILRGKCQHRIPQLNDWTGRNSFAGKTRLLYVNPPRTGLEQEVQQWIVETYRPERIAYLSCSAGTLQRNLLFLEQGGYCVEQIVPYDFFPNTYHVETLALLAVR